MASTQPNPRPSDLSSTELSDAQLLRIHADSETDLLSAAQNERLNTLLQDPQSAARIECEHELRGACARVMDTSASASLQERTMSAMNAVSDADLESGASQHESRVEELAPQTRDRSFWQRFAPLALAAAVSLAAGLVMFRPATPLTSEAALAQAVGFVATEHGHCQIDLDHASRKLKIADTSMLPSAFENLIGREVALSDLVFTGAENVSFQSGGACAVPGGKSMHLRFTLPEGDDASLFIQDDRGALELNQGVTYKSVSDDPEAPSVFIWDRAGLTYYLVTERDRDCANLRDCIKAPDTIVEVQRPI